MTHRIAKFVHKRRLLFKVSFLTSNTISTNISSFLRNFTNTNLEETYENDYSKNLFEQLCYFTIRK